MSEQALQKYAERLSRRQALLQRMTDVLYPGKVGSWFRKHELDEVGIRRVSDSCPLATYLKEVLDDNLKVSVGGNYADIGGEIGLPLPEWCKRFVVRIDHPTEKVAGAGARFVFGTEVKGGEAARVLDAVTDQVA